jgi:hypothetical protein
VVRRIAQSRVAVIAHRNASALAALLGHRRNAHAGAQHVIRSIDQRLRAFGEHPGGDASPDPWHGADNGNVRMLALVPGRRQFLVKHLEQPVEVSLGGATLCRRQLHARQQVIGDSLRTDPQAFRHVRLDHPVIIQLREWSRIDEDLGGELTRLTNQLRDLVYRSAPGLLSLCPAADEPWFWTVLGVAPTPDGAAAPLGASTRTAVAGASTPVQG